MLDLIEHAGNYSLFDGLSLLILLGWAALAFAVPPALSRRATRLLPLPARGFYRALIKRGRLAPYLAAAFLSLGASFAVFARMGEPVPAFHDEFSYLLVADTFAHGRLTNPTPAAFPSFETFHVLMQPTYMSKYPPAQGLTLALGQAATGFPIVGVWLMMAFAGASALWLLRAVLPPRWAFWGAVALVLHPEITAWSSCYWGGGAALAGGALILGGAARFAQSDRLRPRRDGVLFGVGVSLLVLSRPFEGMVLLCVTLAGLVYALRRTKRTDKAVGQAVACGLVPVGLTAAFLLLYNHAVTGSAWTLPYSLYTKTVESYPPFRWWPRLPMHEYSSPTMGVFYRHWARKFDAALADPVGTFPHFASLAGQAVFSLGCRGGLLGVLLLVGVLGSVVGFKRLNRVLCSGLLIIFAFFVVLTGHFWILPHYAAPVAPAVLAVALAGLRLLGTIRLPKSRRAGTLMACFVLPALSLLAFCGYVSGQAAPGTPEFQSYDRYWNYARAAVQAKIANGGGKHLVFVQYQNPHLPDKEWVFNGADFQNAPVLWAHSLGPQQNADVQNAYPDRKAWLIVVSDTTPPEAVPYPASGK